jgi:hypothetical protein
VVDHSSFLPVVPHSSLPEPEAHGSSYYPEDGTYHDGYDNSHAMNPFDALIEAAEYFKKGTEFDFEGYLGELRYMVKDMW